MLLFGDSYAWCATPAADCWQGLLERSELSDRLCLLNYGAGGYGLDQTVLLLDLALPRFIDRDPIVVVSLLVDDDLDRSLLDVRGWPKPRFELADGTLVRVERELPATREDFLAEDGVRIGSYAWRWFVHGTRLLPWRLRRWPIGDLDGRMVDLNRALLADVVDRLEVSGVPFAFLLFHGWSIFDPTPSHGLRLREDLVTGELDRLGTPWISSRRAILEDAALTGRGRGDYFLLEGRMPNHYTPLGNAVVFAPLRDALSVMTR